MCQPSIMVLFCFLEGLQKGSRQGSTLGGHGNKAGVKRVLVCH